MNTYPEYTHIIVECRRCPAGLIDHPATVRKAIRVAAESCGLHIVKEGIHRFRPQGVTGFALLRESHISVHTWPESRFALVDVMSCTEVDTTTLVSCFRTVFKPEQIRVRAEERCAIESS
jgi:S-adenosylmethionine decarboxylase proenzyme